MKINLSKFNNLLPAKYTFLYNENKNFKYIHIKNITIFRIKGKNLEYYYELASIACYFMNIICFCFMIFQAHLKYSFSK